MSENHWEEIIKKDIAENDIVVYMRGEPEAPRCGFSMRVMNVLGRLELPIKTRDMDAGGPRQDPESLWGTLSRMNDWPTSPQIFVKGEFVGGCDNVIDMVKSGDLQKMLEA